MDERHAYRAHRVDLVLLETTRGHFRWIVFIDGEHMSVCPEAMTSLVNARQDALDLAHTMIDTLVSSRPPAPSHPCLATGREPAQGQPVPAAMGAGVA